MKQINTELIESLIAPYKNNLQYYIDKYIPNKKIKPITEDIYLVEYGDQIYNQLKNDKARAWCNVKTGKIYVCNDIELTGHLLIHEFIHRISTNRIILNKVQGINYNKNSYGINESITEKLTVLITNTSEESNPYFFTFKLLDFLIQILGLDFILNSYFTNNLKIIKKKLKNNAKFTIDSFNTIIHSAELGNTS